MLQFYIRHEWVFHIWTITSAGIHVASSLCIFHHCYSLDLECSSLLPHALVSSDKALVIQNPVNMLYSLFATFSSFSEESAHLLSCRLALSSTYSHRKVRITRHDYSLLHASFPSSSVRSLKAGASIFLSPRAEENSWHVGGAREKFRGWTNAWTLHELQMKGTHNKYHWHLKENEALQAGVTWEGVTEKGELRMRLKGTG